MQNHRVQWFPCLAPRALGSARCSGRKPHQLSVMPPSNFANDNLPFPIRVSSVPVLRREYPHPWLPAFMVRRPPTPYLNKRFPKFPWKKSPKFRPAIRLKLQLVLGGTRSCSSNKTTRDYPFSRRDSRALRNPQVPVPNPQAPFPTAQATFPTPQVALNLSASQFHRPLRRNNLRTKIENSSSNLSVPLPSI